MPNIRYVIRDISAEKSSLGKVVINNLTPGMVIVADVRDRSGRLLLGAGTELDDRNIRILRTWGVIEVEVAGAVKDGTGAISTNSVDPVRFAAMERKVAPLFSHTDLNHPAVRELLQMRILREAGNADH
jgi:hypothetical protein